MGHPLCKLCIRTDQLLKALQELVEAFDEAAVAIEKLKVARATYEDVTKGKTTNV